VVVRKDKAMVKIEVSRIHKLDGNGATKAFVDIVIEDAFLVHGLRIVEGKDGLFVAMPREEGKDGKWFNTVIPLKREVKEELERIIMEAYGD
jgi:stage V sporulation protein G